MAGKSSDIVTINISMPRALKKYIDQKVSKGDYGSVSEFMRDAVRGKRETDKHRQAAMRELEAKLIEGLESGPGIEMTEAFWAKKLAALRAKHGHKAKSA